LDLLDDHVKWREKMIERINSFKDESKKKLWDEEENIKKSFSDRFSKL